MNYSEAQKVTMSCRKWYPIISSAYEASLKLQQQMGNVKKISLSEYCWTARKGKNLSPKGIFALPSPRTYSKSNYSLYTSCRHFTSARLRNILYNKPLSMNTVPLQMKTTKGLILSYQSCLVSKPLHCAEPTTHCRSEHGARALQGTAAFHQHQAEPSLYV